MNTKTLRFSGASDDSFECEGGDRNDADEIGCYGGAAVFVLRDAAAEGTRARGMQVYAAYAPAEIAGAVWVVGIAPLDDGELLPTWPMQWTLSARGYSPELILTVPETVLVTCALDGAGDGAGHNP